MNCPHCKRTDEHRHHSSTDLGYPEPKHVITCPVCGYTMAYPTRELVDDAEAGVPVECTACGNACDPCSSVPLR